MAEKTSKQVSTTVSGEVFEALENHRWPARKKMTEVVAEAINDYIAKNNIEVADTKPGTNDDQPEKAPVKK